jgi:hypothetical protein
MEAKRREPVGTPGPHDFFACPGCMKSGKDISDDVEKISRWSDALIRLSPPAEEGEADPDEVELPGGLNVATLTEGLAHAISYVSARLRNDLQVVAVCRRSWIGCATRTSKWWDLGR